MKRISLLVLLVCLMCGCSSSGKVLAGHFDRMHDIADANALDCARMSRELTKYLEDNRASIRSAGADNKNADQKEADHIFKSSYALHQSTEVCQTPEMTAFWKSLSDLVLQASDKG